MRILLVEDHHRLASLICKGLKAANFDVDAVGTAEAVLDAVEQRSYDALILDLGLPDQDGLDLLKSLRGECMALPVLILTARITVSDRVKGLNVGADDYVTKPFAMDELVARLHALLRRPGDVLGQVLTTGDISFDVVAREAQVKGAHLDLSPQEARALELLLRRSGRVVPKTLMEQKLYTTEDEISSNSVEVLIHRLRKRLATAKAEAVIHTVHGIGYMILANEL